MDRTLPNPDVLARAALAALLASIAVLLVVMRIAPASADLAAATIDAVTPSTPHVETASDVRARILGKPAHGWTAMRPPAVQPQILHRGISQYRDHGAARVYRDRPAGFTPNAIVIHATGSGAPGSGFSRIGQLQQFFAGPSARASSQYGVGRDGRIMQFVADDEAAFHTAQPGWNDIAIGIELLNDNTGSDPFPRQQILAAEALVRTLGAKYDIPVQAVVRHRDVQADRSDPASNFPWTEFRADLT